MSIRQRLKKFWRELNVEFEQQPSAKVYLFKAETDSTCVCGKEIKKGEAIIYIARSKYHTCMSCAGRSRS